MRKDRASTASSSSSPRNAENLQRTLENLLAEKYEPVAIVGVGMRFPGGVDSVDAFSRMLRSGTEGISKIPHSRWDNSQYFDPANERLGSICTDSGGYLDDIDKFDPAFFSISPKEANYVDPQQRMMLELTWEALESANIDPLQLSGTSGAVYVGMSSLDYSRELLSLPEDALVSQMGTGSANSAVSGRISYFLGMRGPCMTIDTACSSSLVALHLAAGGLRRREADIAICGAINLIHHPISHVIFSRANMLSPDGRCKTFDESADGYGRSEGAAVVVLKRLSDAIENGETILGLVRGTAVLQDGESGGLTAPNGPAQEIVMKKAIAESMLTPLDVSYVEAHGTGTPLGDPIEIHSINNVFGQHYSKAERIPVGSVKTNLGHSEAVAGMCGLIKVLLQIKEKCIFPHINLTNPSKHIDWESICTEVPTETREWNSGRKRALVNSFGFSGTIASAVIEQPPEIRQSESAASTQSVLTISTKTLGALKRHVDNYLEHVKSAAHFDLEAFCYTSNVSRSHFTYRLAAMADSQEDLLRVLQKYAEDPDRTAKAVEKSASFRNHKLAFLFTGQGSQYLRMGRSLYENNIRFRTYMDECDQKFLSHMGVSIVDVMHDTAQKGEAELNDTRFTQPALFAIEYSLAKLWISYGITPSVLLGHSIGEIVAACVAGLFSLDDAIRMVETRARLMSSVRRHGKMVAVRETQATVAPFLEAEPSVSLAAVNSPQQCVFSGDAKGVDEICRELDAVGIEHTRLDTSHAFHSSHMDEILDEFRSFVSTVNFKSPDIPFVSNVSGELAQFKEVACADYWARHIRSTVKFAQGMKTIADRGKHIFLEVGPNAHLIALGKQCVKATDHAWVPTLKAGDDDVERLGAALVELQRMGKNLDWQSIHDEAPRKTSPLPSYAFEKKRYWLTGHRKVESARGHHPLLGSLTEKTDSEHVFSTDVSPDNPSYLADHVIMGRTLFPATGYLEIVLAVQDAVFGRTDISIVNFKVSEPLILQDETSTLLQTRLVRKDPDKYDLEILSGESGVASRSHFTCALDLSDSTLAPVAHDILRPDDETEFDSSRLYESFRDFGLEYGEKFRRVTALQRVDSATAYGRIAAHEADAHEIVNPTLFDAAMHTLAGVVEPGTIFLPVSIGKLRLFRKPRKNLETQVLVQSDVKSGDPDLVADLTMFSDGEPVLAAEGLGLQALKAAAKTPNKEGIHAQKWVRQTLAKSDFKEFTGLFVGDLKGADDDRFFKEHQDNVTRVDDVASIEDYLEHNPSCDSIVYFWRQSAVSDADQARIADGCRTNFQQVMSLIRLLETKFGGRDIRLFFVTRGAQIVKGADGEQADVNSLSQSTLWGFVNVLNAEFSRFRAKVIDFRNNAAALDCYRCILRELFLGSSDSDYQVAYRGSRRYVRRLAPFTHSEDVNFRVGISEYGEIDNLEKQPIDRQLPVDDEIEVRVCAVGINFKDVLNVLGMLKQHADDNGYEYRPMPLGFEGSGVVTAVGEAADYQVGDEVIVSQIGCMQRYLTVSSKVAVRKPPNITFAQAAGLPTAYVTSYYSLYTLGGLKEGEKVLIHAAAGGVGQASVQLAKHAGAEVFATASQPKWDFLAQQGIRHIMNSRNLDFIDQIKLETDDQGVDLVLNSFSGDYIGGGLSVLSEGGRFVEIGKLGIWDDEQVRSVRNDVEYHSFDLSELPEEELKGLNKEILEDVVGLLEKGEISPLPTTTFSLDEMTEAFGTLSRGQNIGKVVLDFEEEEALANANPVVVDSRSTYLITGGYGALGIKAAAWLARKGARRIALIGRNRPADSRINEIKAQINYPELELQCLEGDIADSKVVGKLVADLNAEDSRLAGIIHAAGLLRDAPISSLKWEQISEVFQPKVDGTLLLHSETSKFEPLDFFICYSSVASVLGSAGQANYASANAYIDALMSWRAATGLNGLSINWGPWAETGMASRLTEAQQKSIRDRGIQYIEGDSGMAALSDIADTRSPQAIVGRYDWATFSEYLPFPNGLYEALVGKSESPRRQIQLEDLLELSIDERHSKITDLVRDITAQVLQFESAQDIEIDSKFSDLGLDSLVAVELKNAIERLFGTPLPSTVVFDYPSIPSLAECVATEVAKLAGESEDEPLERAS